MRFFRVTPPTAHRMLLTLEKRGLISRRPGAACAIAALVEPATRSETVRKPNCQNLCDVVLGGGAAVVRLLDARAGQIVAQQETSDPHGSIGFAIPQPDRPYAAELALLHGNRAITPPLQPRKGGAAPVLVTCSIRPIRTAPPAIRSSKSAAASGKDVTSRASPTFSSIPKARSSAAITGRRPAIRCSWGPSCMCSTPNPTRRSRASPTSSPTPAGRSWVHRGAWTAACARAQARRRGHP